jgi:hypothetical protein
VHPNDIRGPIESEFNRNRDDLEKKYIEDRKQLESEHQDALRSNEEAKRDALVESGLNPDGGVPVDWKPAA